MITQDHRLFSLAYKLFTIDIRSLAFMRIGIGFIILWQLFNYHPLADVFFTGQGVLPRGIQRGVLDGIGLGSAWSIYSLNDSAAFVVRLMALHAVAALFLTLGCFTRTATIICLLLTYSLQMRNPLITTGGDVLLRALLAWSIFLPVGAFASIDCLWRQQSRWKSSQVTSVATVGLIVQLACVYFFAGIAKLNMDWISGEALGLALQLKMYVKPLGEWLLNWPLALKVVTWGTLAAELGVLFFLFTPNGTNFFRGIICGIFCWMHLGIALTMSIGIFSITCLVAWVALVPKGTWLVRTNRSIFVRTDKKRPFEYSAFAQIAAGILLLFVVVINIFSVLPRSKVYDEVLAIGAATMLTQEFKMFGEIPHEDVRFDYFGTTKSGLRVDLFQRESLKAAKERSVYVSMISQPWRRLHWNVAAITDANDDPSFPALETLRQRLLDYQVARWNKTYRDDPIETATLVCRHTKIFPAGTDLTEVNPESRQQTWASFPAPPKP